MTVSLISEYIIPVLTFIAGTGSTILLSRLRFRADGAKLRKEEFTSFSEVVEQATKQIAQLSAQVRDLEVIRTSMTEEIEELKRENTRMRDVFEQLVKKGIIEPETAIKTRRSKKTQ